MKRDRSTFGYMEPHPDIPDHAQCGSCGNWGKNQRCYWLQKNDEVDEDDSCILYGQGEPKQTVEPTGQYTKKDLGFVDHQVRCENCNAFDNRNEKRLHCDLYVQLNRMMPNLWNLEEEVKPRACCNAQMPGSRDPRMFGPYGPIPDADDKGAKGGLITRLNGKSHLAKALA